MTMATATETAPRIDTGRRGAPRADDGPAVTVAQMAREGVEALGALYAKGTPPRLSELDGTPQGRMLAWVGPLGRDRALRAVGRFARSSGFPWGGKSFQSQGDARGRGINRVKLLGDVFPFETRFGPSALDGRPCLILDYDLKDNPWLIRQIHDELREVGRGVFLGPAMWKARPAPKLVLFFAIERRL